MIIVHGMKDCVDCLILKNWLILYKIPFEYLELESGLVPRIMVGNTALIGLDECLKWIEIEYNVRLNQNGYGRPC